MNSDTTHWLSDRPNATGTRGRANYPLKWLQVKWTEYEIFWIKKPDWIIKFERNINQLPKIVLSKTDLKFDDIPLPLNFDFGLFVLVGDSLSCNGLRENVLNTWLMSKWLTEFGKDN